MFKVARHVKGNIRVLPREKDQKRGDPVISSIVLPESKPAMGRKQYNTIIWILGSLSAIGPFSIDMYLPGFPAIAADLSTDMAHVGLTLTSYFLGISLGQLAYGPVMDRYGRKKPLMLGLMAHEARQRPDIAQSHRGAVLPGCPASCLAPKWIWQPNWIH